jgi:hypothetical protein
MERPKGLTYRDAGVDIDAQDEALRRIKDALVATRTPGVLADLGAFGGLFAPDLKGMTEPVLVASADGVGTKLDVAVLAGVHDTVGRDLVNHCVNDILVQGARPSSSSTTWPPAGWIRRCCRPSSPGSPAAAGRTAVRSWEERRRRCPASTETAGTTWRASSWGWWTARRCSTARG